MNLEEYATLIRQAAESGSEEKALQILIAGGMDEGLAEETASRMFGGGGDIIEGAALDALKAEGIDLPS